MGNSKAIRCTNSLTESAIAGKFNGIVCLNSRYYYDKYELETVDYNIDERTLDTEKIIEAGHCNLHANELFYDLVDERLSTLTITVEALRKEVDTLKQMVMLQCNGEFSFESFCMQTLKEKEHETEIYEPISADHYAKFNSDVAEHKTNILVKFEPDAFDHKTTHC